MPPRNPHHGASPRLSGGRGADIGKPWRVSTIPWARLGVKQLGVKHAFIAFAAVFVAFATLQAGRALSVCAWCSSVLQRSSLNIVPGQFCFKCS